jgi:TPR repeat protein
MPTEIVRHQTPEQVELLRKREELALARAELAERELELVDLRARLKSFEGRYLREVGVLYAKVDEWEAKIAELETSVRPSAASSERADGAPLDYAEAIVWFRRAADRCNAEAMVRLGLMHYMGWGVPQDDAASFGWYQKAAAAGCAVGQFWLGYSYRNGIGTTRDDAQAIIWDLRSAEQGYAKAQSWLGSVYLGYGERFGVSSDPQESYFWSYLAHESYAAENRSVLAESAAHKRDKAASSLTEAALTYTQDRARKWLEARRISTVA